MCGFIGIFGPDGVDVAPEIYEGLIAVQHRGQDSAGIITFTDPVHVKKGLGLVLEVFEEKDMKRLRGHLGLGHVRYPTVGPSDDGDAQPLHLTFPVGIAMAHNGNLTNFGELKGRLSTRDGTRLNSSGDLELILYVFARALNERVASSGRVTSEDVFRAVRAVYSEARGAYSVVAVLPDAGMVAFRDPHGIKPLVVGRKETKEGVYHACASESVVLDVNGYDRLFDVAAGEAVFVGEDRVPVRRKLADAPHRPCIFELVYFARPDSFLDDISVYKTRRRFGEALAEQWRTSGAPMPDVVIPIPDSSRDSALAMALELGRPFREGLVKNRYIGRTFIMPTHSGRQESIRRKLNPIPLEFEDKDVLLVDDSIVRGTTSRKIVEMARASGARKVYLASTSPPLVAPCPYGIDMASKTEFIADDRKDIAAIAREIGVDHLVYLDRERMNEAARAGNPRIEQFCNACFTGDYPTGDVTRELLQAIADDKARNRDRPES